MQAAYEGEVENTTDGDQHDKNGHRIRGIFPDAFADP